MNNRNLFVYVVIGSLILGLAMIMQNNVTTQSATELDYTELVQAAEAGEIKFLTKTSDKVTGELVGGEKIYSVVSLSNIGFDQKMAEFDVPVVADDIPAVISESLESLWQTEDLRALDERIEYAPVIAGAVGDSQTLEEGAMVNGQLEVTDQNPATPVG